MLQNHDFVIFNECAFRFQDIKAIGISEDQKEIKIKLTEGVGITISNKDKDWKPAKDFFDDFMTGNMKRSKEKPETD